ncbi:PAS domain-containing sensor histidine kinase [bacterium]|nr:PAS domain-containing sensor histidine kinase [bacterium]MBU1918255.1 PAS domain-containing sensor histidine kinase [bacterium]
MSDSELRSQKTAPNVGVEHTIKESEIYKAIIESSQDAIFTRTIDGIITFWNHGAEIFYGYSPEEIVGHTFERLIPDDRKKEYKYFIKQIKQGKKIISYETKRKTKKGSIKYVLITTFPLYSSYGIISGSVTIARDITKQKQLEIRKDDFNSLVAHELRNPVAVIRTGIQSLGMVTDEFTLAQKKFIDIIDRQSSRLQKIIDNLLELARFESKNAIINFRKVVLQDVIDSVVSDQTLEIDKNIKLQTSCTTSDFIVYVDEDLLTRVLINLLNNAVRFTRSFIKINVEPFLEKNKHYIKISVSDDGSGIDKEGQNKLFNKFSQVTRPVSGSGYKGTGLGLALCKEMVVQLHGRIWIETSSPEGTTISFLILKANVD